MTKTKKRLALLAAALWLAACLLLTIRGAKLAYAEDLAVKLDAAARMRSWMDAIVEYKAEAGLGLTADDIHGTGLIGEPWTWITTTSGALEAKRTAADPDMAALMVQMLTEAGVEPGDRVGAGFSGSFPGLDLAVLAACEAMEVECVYIASIGASTYGANQPEFTFPDMVVRLHADGLLQTAPATVTGGGQKDCGADMDPALRQAILDRMEAAGQPVMLEPDFAANIAARMELHGEIDCFVGVGGNLTTTGPGEKNVPYGLIRPYTITAVDERSGLVQRYNAEGVPVLHLLNVKQLVTDYGMAYDPAEQLPPGESAVYFTTEYPRLPAAVGLLGAAAILLAVKFWPVKEELG